MLNEVVWKKVKELYCPHTVDLMASDENAMKVQDLSKGMNSYVLPLFRMIFPMEGTKCAVFYLCHCIFTASTMRVFFTVIEKCYAVICFDR